MTEPEPAKDVIARVEQDNRRFRQVITAVALVLLSASTIASTAGLFLAWRATTDNHHVLVVIEKATSPQAAAAGQATLHNAITFIVTQTDCNGRRTAADVLHIALPTQRFTLPATAACPAYDPGA